MARCMDITHHYSTVINEEYDVQKSSDEEDDGAQGSDDNECTSDETWSDGDLDDNEYKSEEAWSDGDLDDNEYKLDETWSDGDLSDDENKLDDSNSDKLCSDDTEKVDGVQITSYNADDNQLVVKKPLVRRSGFWNVASTFLTDQLCVHTVTCDGQGRMSYIVRRELLEKSGLSSQYSECSLRRRCNRVIGGHQYATSVLLRALKDQKLVSPNAKKVAVVTIQQARDILTSYGHSTSISKVHKEKKVTRRTDNTAEMESLRRYLTAAICPERKSLNAPINHRTAKETISTTDRFCRVVSSDHDGGIALCADASSLKSYFNSLIGSHNPSTLCSYACNLKRAVHFCKDALHLDTKEAEEYLTTVERQLRRQKSKHSVNWKQLALQDRWIHWPDVLKGAGVLKRRFEEETEEKAKANACMDYVIYLFLTMLPPGRAIEFAAMEIVDQRHHPQQTIGENTNACVISRDGQVSLRFGEYKTAKTYGVQICNLCSNEACRKHLVPLILAYIDKWRPLRAGSGRSSVLFVQEGGQPYERAGFCHQIRRLIKLATGVKAGVAVLRKSFVTHFVGSGSGHRGIATSMRHSIDMQTHVYNMVSNEEEMASALELSSTACSQYLSPPKGQLTGRRTLKAVSIERCPVK